MWKTEPKDPGDVILDRLLERTLQGEIISFDEWIDDMEELDDLPEVELTKDDLHQASVVRNDFIGRLSKHGLSRRDLSRGFSAKVIVLCKSIFCNCHIGKRCFFHFQYDSRKILSSDEHRLPE